MIQIAFFLYHLFFSFTKEVSIDSSGTLYEHANFPHIVISPLDINRSREASENSVLGKFSIGVNIYSQIREFGQAMWSSENRTLVLAAKITELIENSDFEEVFLCYNTDATKVKITSKNSEKINIGDEIKFYNLITKQFETNVVISIDGDEIGLQDTISFPVNFFVIINRKVLLGEEDKLVASVNFLKLESGDNEPALFIELAALKVDGYYNTNGGIL